MRSGKVCNRKNRLPNPRTESTRIMVTATISTSVSPGAVMNPGRCLVAIGFSNSFMPPLLSRTPVQEPLDCGRCSFEPKPEHSVVSTHQHVGIARRGDERRQV